jgi:hypothetical protein
MTKMNAENRTHAVFLACRSGLLSFMLDGASQAEIVENHDGRIATERISPLIDEQFQPI